ncbi:DNA repair protein RecO [Pseudorhodoferax sp. LjRoot39]|uniref:DNA repair protein RecO n=1 Tax=Pseudorhodoferax sp. LjRoot39 TaxID=3342328 RepID=UPI003ECF901E
MAVRRVLDEPAYVLHRYDWSESSLILDVFTRRHGRVALVAKGAKRPSSSFRPVLLPLQALRLAFGGDGEIRTLKGAEWGGGHVMPTGDALLAGYYLNELLQRLLAREDAHPELFDAYGQAVALLASEHGEALQPVLRSFELLLLRETGVLPALDLQTATLAPLEQDTQYTLVPEGGLRERHGDDRAGLAGAQWVSLHEAMQDVAPFMATLHAGAHLASALKPQLRTLLHYHCGGTPLHTRQLMMDLQAL